MASYLALFLSLLLANMTAQASQPPMLATPLTARDHCFQQLRVHEERWAEQHGYQIQALDTGYGGGLAGGDFACRGRFEVRDEQGQLALGPWRLYMLFRR